MLPISKQLLQRISLSGPAMSCPATYGISRIWVINCLQQLARTPGPSGSLVTLWEPITFSCIFMPFHPQAIKAAPPALCPFPLLCCTSSPPETRRSSFLSFHVSPKSNICSVHNWCNGNAELAHLSGKNRKGLPKARSCLKREDAEILLDFFPCSHLLSQQTPSSRELNERYFSYPSSIWDQLSWCTSVTVVAVKMMDLDQFIPTEDLDSAEWDPGLQQVMSLNAHVCSDPSLLPKVSLGLHLPISMCCALRKMAALWIHHWIHAWPQEELELVLGWVHRAVGSSMKCCECSAKQGCSSLRNPLMHQS